MKEHPDEGERSALSLPRISRTPPDDSQPNPPDTPDSVWIHPKGITPEEEISVVVRSVKDWVSAHPDETVAILVPRNARGFKFAEALRANDVKYVELLQSTTSTRQTAGVLGTVLNYLADPTSAAKLAEMFRAWRRQDREDPETAARLKRLTKRLRRCRHVEEYLWPRFDNQWPAALGLNGIGAGDTSLEENNDSAEDFHILADYREVVKRWQKYVMMPN